MRRARRGRYGVVGGAAPGAPDEADAAHVGPLFHLQRHLRSLFWCVQIRVSASVQCAFCVLCVLVWKQAAAELLLWLYQDQEAAGGAE